ncbi:hypothetical protein [Streptomyces graminilatus]|uniref:hypothetical protein n=1 Tax=Streptomyces graminilatus TaxID=1464070 RepID=UPI0007C6ACD2|nr:hypothetical protein [Streptomyces graminilatus]
MPSLDFLLTARDGMSRVLDRAGDAANRFGRRLTAAANDGDGALTGLTRSADGQLRDVRGRFVATGDAAGMMSAQFSAAQRKGQEFASGLKKGLLSLAPAAVPAAASLAPVVASVAAGGVAVAAFGAAVVPQIQALSEASQANKKYQDAVKKTGERSQAAVTAQAEYQRMLAEMPPAAREATVAVSGLKDEYQDWSNGLAGDTMPVVTKSMALFTGLLPKTSGLVRGTSHELSRLMTVAAGGMQTPGFDGFMQRLEKFSTGVVHRAVDGIVHLSRAGKGSEVGSNVAKFMDYARAQGPAVGETLRDLTTALTHLLLSASDVGVGMLDIVNALAGLAAAVPSGLLTTLFQLAVALKAIRLAGTGMASVALGIAGVRTQIILAGSAAAGATGRVAKVTAAIGALSRGAKLAMAGTGIGLLILALGELSSRGKQAPPDVDKLTSSLQRLGRDGSVSGEAARAFGKNLEGLHGKVRALTDPSTTDKIQQFVVSIGGLADWDSTPVADAKANIDAIDKALAGMVSNGQADLAAAAVKRLTAEYGKGGRDTREFTRELGDYRDAIADSKFEQELAAESQGLFGAQAQKTRAALAAQKQSADGLRQSIVALNDVNRQGLSGMIGFEASIDAAAKAARENAGVLTMQGGKLNLAGEKSRAAATALNDLAAKTDEATASARESGASWQAVNGIYTRGRNALIKTAQAMGLTKAEARSLADQILKTPDKTARLKGNIEDLEAKVAAAKKRLGSVPPSRKAFVRGDISNLEYEISRAQQRLRDIDGKTAVTYVLMKTKTSNAGTVFHEGGNYATGGPIGFPRGGPISGPGTSTSDDIPIMASNGEYMINARSYAKHRALVEAINADKLGTGHGMGGAGAAVAQGLAGGMAGSSGLVKAGARRMAAEVTAGVREELEIRSPSKKTIALAKDAGRGLIVGLTGSRDKIRSTAADLANDIRKAFSGRKESGLVRMVTAQTNRLMSLAARRDRIAARIAEAKSYAREVTTNARGSAQLGNLGLEVVTGRTIKAALGNKLARIKRFTAYIKKLAARGLHKSLLRQVLDMGPEQGLAYAAALAEADKATLSGINKTESGLESATKGLGEIGADRLYDAGKNASKGFLKGLESQQKALERVMQRIALAMQKALRKALGIASPAKKMIPDGINTVKGVAVGVLQGLPHIDGAMQAVAGRMTGRAVAMRPVAGRQAVAAGTAGAGPVEIHIHVDGTVLDPVAVGRQIQTVLLEFKRARGGAALGLA